LGANDFTVESHASEDVAWHGRRGGQADGPDREGEAGVSGGQERSTMGRQAVEWNLEWGVWRVE